MITVNKTSFTALEAESFVRDCETRFAENAARLLEQVFSDAPPECITLSGPTCSGKTTMANKLTAAIAQKGKTAVVLSIDDFFKTRLLPNTPDHEVDYDSVQAIDLAYLSVCAEKMLRGESTPLPKFDFVSGMRSESGNYTPTPDDIIIFEGIQAVYPEVVRLFSGYPCKSIFISVQESLHINGTVFTPEEIRLSRRIVRDHRMRAASPAFTFHVWESVRKNEEENIYPYMAGCDFQIDSCMAYEPFMIAPHLIPLLESVPIDSPYFTDAMRLMDKYRCVEDAVVSSDLLPADSLYHEFLG